MWSILRGIPRRIRRCMLLVKNGEGNFPGLGANALAIS